MKKFFLTVALTLISVLAFADAVTWNIRLVGDNTENPKVEATATIAPGFHLYAIDNPAGGSNPLVFYFDCKGCQTVGKPTANKAYTKEFDDVFEVNQHFYSGSVTFTQKLKPTAKDFSVSVEIKGQACDDKGCTQVFGSKTLKGKSPVAAEADPKDGAEALAEMTDSLQASEPFMTPEANMSEISADKSWWDNVEASSRRDTGH